MVKLAGIRFTVTGEVASPGTVTLYQNQVSIVEALANAGDITLTGNRRKVFVIRKNIEGVKKYELDMTDVNIFNEESFYVQPNDIVYVEPLKQKSWGTGTTGTQTFTTLISVFSLVTSTILLVRNL
jgi:polysaccharide export outer membrane protein